MPTTHTVPQYRCPRCKGVDLETLDTGIIRYHTDMDRVIGNGHALVAVECRDCHHRWEAVRPPHALS